MKKRWFGLVLIFALSMLSANASDKVHVQALNPVSEENTAESINVKVLQDTLLGDYLLKTDDVIHCDIDKITNPKRGKISATFYVTPVYYTSNGNVKYFEKGYVGKYSKTILSKEEIKKNVKSGKVAKKAAVTVGGFFVKGLSPAVSMAEGMIKNEDGNRLKSGVHQVYEDSPVAYVEKGEPVNVSEGDEFYFIFKSPKSIDSDDDDFYEEE